ncbi:AT-hook motif nuclear-localized protein 5 [Cardamine amara subsp. amara]|uniref:AT-hook motif nuclear-localized protein n=1 Tax=Cardamine amara subsp. amara TaxID=228776 RepID=A0ABD1A2F9_CARAN
MEGREAMAFPGAHTPFYFPRGAFTSISSSSQSASALHAPPPGFRPLSNPNLQHSFPFSEQRHQEMSHGIQMGMASSPIVQPPQLQLPSPPPPSTAELAVKKKRGRPRKYVPDNQVALGLSPVPCSHKAKSSASSLSDPNAPKRARGRPPGTGRKQRLANLGEWMNTSAGLAFAPHVISVEVGEDIVSKIFSFAQQRPRALCIMSGTGKVSSGTLHLPTGSKNSMSIQGNYDILSLGGSYLVNEEGAPKSRTGNLSVSLSRPDGFLVAGGAGTLIAASLVQVVACSFVYGSAKAKAIKQENGSKEDNNNMETPTSEPQPESTTEPAAEAAPQTPLDFSGSGWAGSGGGNNSTDSRNHNHLTDINLAVG